MEQKKRNIRFGLIRYNFKFVILNDRDKISVINNRETEGNVPSVIIPNG